MCVWEREERECVCVCEKRGSFCERMLASKNQLWENEESWLLVICEYSGLESEADWGRDRKGYFAEILFGKNRLEGCLWCWTLLVRRCDEEEEKGVRSARFFHEGVEWVKWAGEARMMSLAKLRWKWNEILTFSNRRMEQLRNCGEVDGYTIEWNCIFYVEWTAGAGWNLRTRNFDEVNVIDVVDGNHFLVTRSATRYKQFYVMHRRTVGSRFLYALQAGKFAGACRYKWPLTAKPQDSILCLNTGKAPYQPYSNPSLCPPALNSIRKDFKGSKACSKSWNINQRAWGAYLIYFAKCIDTFLLLSHQFFLQYGLCLRVYIA